MTHFKNFLSVAAVVAVVSFSSFSMSAQSKSKIKDRTPNTEYMLNDEGMAYKQADEAAQFIYNKDNMGLIIAYMNVFTPYTLDEDFELTSVSMEDDEININTTCDYYTALAISQLDEEQHDYLEQLMAAALYEIFNAMGLDDNGDSMIAKMDELDITVNYNFYIEGFELPVKTLTFDAQFIERAGLIENMVYSI